MPRMWDGGMGTDGIGDKAKERDLTNTKLAKNQLVRASSAIYPEASAEKAAIRCCWKRSPRCDGWWRSRMR